MNRPKLALALIALSTLVVWMWATSTAQAQDQSILIEGQVTNGTTDGDGAGGLTVLLHQESTTIHNHLETSTDADGRFRLEGIVFDPTVAYGVSVRYQGGLYGIDLDLSAGSPSPVSLTVYEATSGDEMLSMPSASVLFAHADKSTQMVSVLEIIRIANNSDRAYVPGPQPMDLLRFGLPPDAQGLQVDTHLPGADFIQVDRGFALIASVPPGDHEVMFTYQFPYSGTEVVFSKSFNYGAEHLRVLVPDGVLTLSSELLGAPESADIGGRSYQLIQASDLPRGARISLELHGLPQPSLTESLDRRLEGIHFEYAAPVGLGLLMVLLIAYAFKRRSNERRTGA